MCFTPTISFTIFAIEWILGFIVLSWMPKKGNVRAVYGLAAVILFVLGFYQFTQYMFCISGNFILWGTIGFLTYNFLPAIGVHFGHSLLKKKSNIVWIYVIPIVFSFIAILTPNFVSMGSCDRYYITVEHSWHDTMSLLYGAYYFGFIAYMIYLLNFELKKSKSDSAALVGLIGILSFTIPTFILVIIFPALNIAFPSILCEFALLFAISVFWMISIIDKRH